MTVLKPSFHPAALSATSALMLLLGLVLPSAAPAQGNYYTYYNNTYITEPNQVTYQTEAESISNSGLVGGDYVYSYQDTNDYAYAGFIYNAGVYTSFQYPYFSGCTPPGCTYDVYVNGVNNSGTAVGEADSWAGDDLVSADGFTYSSGTVTKVDYPGATETGLVGINDTNQIIGYALVNGSDVLFSDVNGTFTIIPGYPGAVSTRFTGINNNGQIVGVYFLDSQTSPFVFVYSNGSYSAIMLPVTNLVALSNINDNGQISGTYYNQAVGES